MKYKKSERVQSEYYSSIEEFVSDAIETLLDESNFDKSINIVSDKNTTEEILEYLYQSDLEFKFDIQVVDFRNTSDEYVITILDIGEVYVEPAKDKNENYHELDGFLFVHNNVDSDAYNGRNRRCDVIVFNI